MINKHNDMLNRMEYNMREMEKSESTISKYLSDVENFLSFVKEREINKDIILDYKKSLEGKYMPSSVNSKIASINYFVEFIGNPEYKVKYLKIQNSGFRDNRKELTKDEYFTLVKYAEEHGNIKMCLLLQTICSTGIRIGELSYITVESANARMAMVKNKGKGRYVLLPETLCRMLLMYAKKNAIMHGSIFVTKNGVPVNRSNIYHSMKRLCEHAGVDPNKVYPHNLRHLFAVTYYDAEKDISRLADILGHKNINTTRLYTMVSASK